MSRFDDICECGHVRSAHRQKGWAWENCTRCECQRFRWADSPDSTCTIIRDAPPAIANQKEITK